MPAEAVENLEVSLPDIGFVPVKLRRSARATRLRLKIAPYMDGIEVVMPKSAPKRVALSLLQQHSGWVAKHLTALPDRVAFVFGSFIPVLGQDLLIRAMPKARRGVWQEGSLLCVSGDEAFHERRVMDWLKKQARDFATARARAYAADLGVTVGKVSVRDTRSRWGSCTSEGNLMFSWRLIMAPEAVFEYVVAHEVAHLREMNHSPRFWAHVEALFGDSYEEQRWLKRFGASLHRYGPHQG
jgi:predicted metal-dependent hydrolase